MGKMITILTLMGVFIYLFCYLFLDSLLIETAYLGAIMGYIAIRRGVPSLWREVKVFIPIILMMIGVYALFALISIESKIGLGDTENSWIYWMNYGGVRTVLFLSSILTIGELISYITIQDILSLPFGITFKKSVILGKVLFQKASSALEVSDFTLRNFPIERSSKRSIGRVFRRNITLMLSLVMFLSRESTIRGELIDNRIQHCFSSQKSRKSQNKEKK